MWWKKVPELKLERISSYKKNLFLFLQLVGSGIPHALGCKGILNTTLAWVDAAYFGPHKVNFSRMVPNILSEGLKLLAVEPDWCSHSVCCKHAPCSWPSWKPLSVETAERNGRPRNLSLKSPVSRRDIGIAKAEWISQILVSLRSQAISCLLISGYTY